MAAPLPQGGQTCGEPLKGIVEADETFILASRKGDRAWRKAKEGKGEAPDRKARKRGGKVSISIHVYGGNIGTIRRSVFDPGSGQTKAFVSGYSSDAVPNLWPS